MLWIIKATWFYACVPWVFTVVLISRATAPRNRHEAAVGFRNIALTVVDVHPSQEDFKNSFNRLCRFLNQAPVNLPRMIQKT